MNRILTILSIALLTLGCIGGGEKSDDDTSQSGLVVQPPTQENVAQQPAVDAAPEPSIDEVEVPFIPEDDTVEIGEMI